MGKHKIPIEKIEKKHQRHICFCKRRKGLFKKAADLCDRGCEIAAVVISSSENAFTFARPDLDQVLNRFLGDGAGGDQQLALVPQPEVPVQEELGEEEVEAHEEEEEEDDDDDDDEEDDHMSYEANGSESEEEEEESKMEEINSNNGGDGEAGPSGEKSRMEEGGGGGGGAKVTATAGEDTPRNNNQEVAQWWKQPLQGMSIEELREMERSLTELRGMAMERWKELFERAPLLSLLPVWDPRSQSATVTSKKPSPAS